MASLQKTYPNLAFDNLNEKEIIFLLRDAFSYYTKKSAKMRQRHETELLHILQSRQWQWEFHNMDRHSMLTYALYNGVLQVASYLLPKYDWTTYREERSAWLNACCYLNNEPATALVRTIDPLHPMYVAGLACQGLLMSQTVAPGHGYAQHYEQWAQQWLERDHQAMAFDYFLNRYMSQRDDYLTRVFVSLLHNHPVANSLKKEKIQPLLEMKTGVSPHLKQACEKFLQFLELQDHIPLKEQPKIVRKL